MVNLAMKTMNVQVTEAVMEAFVHILKHSATVIGTLISTGATTCSVIVTISAKAIRASLAHAVLMVPTAKISWKVRRKDSPSTRATQTLSAKMI